MLKFHAFARQPANHYARIMGQRGARRRRRKVGIALGAGGARGLAHVGVLQTLTANGIPIDAVVGTSIGAVVGAAFAAGQIDVFERKVRDFLTRWTGAGCPGPESWIMAPFTHDFTKPLDPDCENAVLWRAAVGFQG